MNSITAIELHIASRLVAARRLRDLSQDSLAQKLGVTKEQIDDYERGHDILPAARLYDVARALHLNVAFFYEGLGGATSFPVSVPGERTLH